VKVSSSIIPLRILLRLGLGLSLGVGATVYAGPPPSASEGKQGCIGPAFQAVRRQLIESQVYKGEGKQGFQVLSPTGKPNHYRVLSFPTLDAAVNSAQAAPPLNLRTAIADATRAMNDEVLPVLKRMEAGTEDQPSGMRITQRTKNLSTLRSKIFGRVAKANTGPEGFDLSKIDDLAGTRVLVRNLRDMPKVAAQITEAFGAERVTPDVKDKPGGYRAVHLTVLTVAGPRIEIQIMTERMEAWSNWDHDRVYKSSLPSGSTYLTALKKYGQEIAAYLRAKDDGLPALVKPDPVEYGIRPADEFPDSKLR
jgi:ppGpp synthetase/RelA/SpoT-type nucleotidyltranferase